jgi:bile acid:Na+ symporter, BASS family
MASLDAARLWSEPMTENIDQIQLNFSPNTLTAINVILGLVMFGIALDLKLKDFKIALSRPRAFLIGISSQFFLFPAAAWMLTQVMDPQPSVALGMIMVAACPGGNMSNFMTHLSKGSTALSVCMTAFSTTLALVMTPFNVTFWGGMDPATAEIMRGFDVEPLQILGSTFIILGFPLTMGLLISERKPGWAEKMRKPFKIGSLFFFVALLVIAFGANFDVFMQFIHVIFWPVALLNAVAVALGYGLARLGRLSRPEARAVSMETGIQNSGLGLVLIFAHFGALGGMASVAAWWGIWHLVVGLGLAFVWTRFFALTEEEEELAAAAP